jgi:hypothetical protein
LMTFWLRWICDWGVIGWAMILACRHRLMLWFGVLG